MKRILMLLLVMVVPMGCATVSTPEPTGPMFPAGAYEISPPPEYKVWFVQLAQCVWPEHMMERKHVFEDIRWFLIPGREFVNPYSHNTVLGTFYTDWKYILLAEELSQDMLLVKHEMIHYFLRPRGGHPMPPFMECEYWGF